MAETDPVVRALLQLLDDLVAQQEDRVRATARRVVPHVTLDDVLAPDDVPALRVDPQFLYEHGQLAGLLGARAAVRALLAERRAP